MNKIILILALMICTPAWAEVSSNEETKVTFSSSLDFSSIPKCSTETFSISCPEFIICEEKQKIVCVNSQHENEAICYCQEKGNK